MFYPEASEERCTAALLLAIDPVGLVRRGRGVSSFALAEYVNDRPYVASSFLSVALVTVFKSAMAGVCKGHEELVGVRDPAGGCVCRSCRREAARRWSGGSSSRSGTRSK